MTLNMQPAPIRVVRAVALELESGRSRWTTYDHLAELLAAGIVEVVDPDAACSVHFEALVVGTAAETLDEGETATIAYAPIISLEEAQTQMAAKLTRP